MEVVVIGGSAAGMKAACRIRRLLLNARVRVLVRDEHFGYSMCGLPHYLSGDIGALEDLVRTPNGTLKDETYFREVKGVEVLIRHEVLIIDRAARYVRCRMLESGREITFPYDKLVIATGARPIIPAIPGIDNPGVCFFTKPADALKLRRDLERGEIKRAVVIGAGFIGLELCEAFRATWGIEVDLIEFQPRLLSAMIDEDLALLVQDDLERHGIKLNVGCGCREISFNEGKLSLSTNRGQTINADRVVIAAGTMPNAALAQRAGLDIGVTGGIKVGDHLETSDPNIFAAGDCVELPSSVDGSMGIWSLGSLASRMGRVAGDNVCNGDTIFGPVAGATILKCFDMTIGSVGLTSADCLEKGYEIECCWGTFYDRMHYYPEAAPVHLKLIADRGSDRVLGIQILSNGNILHLLDVAAQAIRTGATVDELQDLEHAYTPPFGQPFSPLHYLSFILENSRSAGIAMVSPSDFFTLPAETLLLDVRDDNERAKSPLENSELPTISIPLEQLRSRLIEIPSNRPTVAVCQMGGRAWDAALMLRRTGRKDLSFLAGGLLMLPHRKSGVKLNETGS